jgi:hypothetical protein
MTANDQLIFITFVIINLTPFQVMDTERGILKDKRYIVRLKKSD